MAQLTSLLVYLRRTLNSHLWNSRQSAQNLNRKRTDRRKTLLILYIKTMSNNIQGGRQVLTWRKISKWHFSSNWAKGNNLTQSKSIAKRKCSNNSQSSANKCTSTKCNQTVCGMQSKPPSPTSSTPLTIKTNAAASASSYMGWLKPNDIVETTPMTWLRCYHSLRFNHLLRLLWWSWEWVYQVIGLWQ